MKQRKLFLCLLPTVVFTVVVFAGTVSSQAPSITEPAVKPVEVPILRMVSRGHVITVTSTVDGPRYSAHKADGAILVRGLSLGELKVSHPALYQEVNPSIVRTDFSVGPIGSVDLGD